MQTKSVDDWSQNSLDDSGHPTNLVIGLGNPILGDDAIGWRIAEQVQRCLDTNCSTNLNSRIEVDTLAVGGLTLMERMIGYKQAIIIDAIFTGNSAAGTVSCCSLEEFPEQALGHLCSAHDTTLQNALRVGKAMGATLPDSIYVIGIETIPNYEFSEDLSPQIEKSITLAVETVMELIS